MSQKTRGVFQIIYKSFISGFKKKTPPKLMGEDWYGTKYFEESPASSGRKTRGRFFEPVNKDDFEQELPAEWEAWLRYRRREPPTKEEVEANYRLILKKRENAAKLEAEYAEKREKPSTAIEQRTGTFPVYEEYSKNQK